VENETLPNPENMLYYETIAEAMQNLHSTTHDESKETSKRVATVDSLKELNGPERNFQGEEDLYSINKSLYNSSKLFPPTERDIDFESNLDSFQDINQMKYDPNSLNQFNSFKNNSKNLTTDRNVDAKEKNKILSYFEVRKLIDRLRMRRWKKGML
jgi:hypothetical protein